MATSRDANDPRDELRAMRREAHEEFQDEEMGDTGGSTHRSREDREGVPAARRAPEAGAREGTAASGEGEQADDAVRGPERAAGLPVTPSPDPGAE